VIIEPRFSPDQRRQINDLAPAEVLAKDTPGPQRAFFLRIRGRRGEQIAAVATARKLAVLVWQLLTTEQDYAWGRPLLAAQVDFARALEEGHGCHQRGARLLRRSATCAVGLAASFPTLRSGSPVPPQAYSHSPPAAT